MSVKNAKKLPEIFYGLHMVEGVAEYREQNKDPYRIMLGESTIKAMDPSFAGCPVYVQHVDDVNLDTMQADAAGYVVESFFNKADGKHWAKFIVVSDDGHEAIRRGWKLSNAYIPHSPFGKGGQWHGVDYDKEILSGEYEHLAIVQDPRYQESIILTPEEFKKYNEEKENELIRIANSKDKGESQMKLSLFKRTKVENSADLEGMMVTLPKSKKEIAIIDLVNEFDTIQNMNGYANGDHMVKVGDKDEMSVNDLVKKHMEMCNEMAAMQEKKNDGGTDGEVMENEESDEDDEEAKKKKENEEADLKAKKENEDKEAEEKKKNSKANFDKLKNAASRASEEVAIVELSEDQVARGKTRYGSK